MREVLADLDALVPLQRDLLAAALDSAAPGGVVAYVTCSPHRRETTEVVQAVLAGREQLVPDGHPPEFDPDEPF